MKVRHVVLALGILALLAPAGWAQSRRTAAPTSRGLLVRRQGPGATPEFELGIWGAATIFNRNADTRFSLNLYGRGAITDVVGIRIWVGAITSQTSVRRFSAVSNSHDADATTRRLSTGLWYGGIGLDLTQCFEGFELGVHFGPGFWSGSRIRPSGTLFAGFIGLHANIPFSDHTSGSPGVALNLMVDFMSPFRSVGVRETTHARATHGVSRTRSFGGAWLVGAGLSVRW